MRHLLTGLLLVLAPTASFAQTVITDPATQGTLVWTQAGVRGTAFDRFEVSVVTTGQPAVYASIGLPTPTTGTEYRYKLPATLVDGAYTAAVRTCLSTVIAPTAPCSASLSGAFTVARPVTPPPPTNFQIVVTVVAGLVASVRIVP